MKNNMSRQMTIEWDIGYFTNPIQRKKIPKRTINERLVSWELAYDYYDGSRNVGYGGFSNDGRWTKLVPKLIERFKIPEKAKIVDLGCKKGFILEAFKENLPNAELIGVENHQYPIEKADDKIRKNIILSNLYQIPCEDNTVSFLISFSAIYMQNLGDVVKTLKEIMRVSNGRSYITVGAFRNEAEKSAFLDWTLIGTTILSIEDWNKVFNYAGYTGQVFFTTPLVLGLNLIND